MEILDFTPINPSGGICWRVLGDIGSLGINYIYSVFDFLSAAIALLIF